MLKKICVVIALMNLLVFAEAHAASVYEKGRNIFYADNGKTLQLTSLNRDEDPKIDPKGEWVYFIRGTPGKWDGEKYYPAKGEIVKDGVLGYEIWRIRVNGSDAKVLFRNGYMSAIDVDPEYNCASVNNIQFSPDGDKVYFETPDWVTSAGLHVMNPDGSGEKLLGGGNETKILLSAREIDPKYGSCRGYIVTSQHRYWWFGGSYDWYYLFTPDFKEVAPLGDDFAYFTEMGDIIYTNHSEKNDKKK